MPTPSEFFDPRLVAVYDTLNFYLDLAAELSASAIVDIGGGTGLFTCEPAEHGHRLIGVASSGAMLGAEMRRVES